jgi:hypothetical protein
LHRLNAIGAAGHAPSARRADAFPAVRALDLFTGSTRRTACGRYLRTHNAR